MPDRPSLEQIKKWLLSPAPVSDLRAQIRSAAVTPRVLETMRAVVPDVHTIPMLTYTQYREFEHTGERPGYEGPYFLRRAMLTRALVEYIMGDETMLYPIQDLLWAICEETSWVLPAHEEQGPDYWDINPPIARTTPLGAHTALTREPDSIDLFAAETGAIVAETIYLIGDDLAAEVRQRARQEVERHIFKPYLAYGRKHWWFKGALNWNGVCNGAIGLAFLHLEQDIQTLAEALSMVLEGFEAYIATGFEADGGSVEGVGYWNFGLMYYVTVAELLGEISGGEFDLLAAERLKDIAYYPVGMALTAPMYLNFGDVPDTVNIAAGIAQRLSERTGVAELRALVGSSTQPDEHSYSIAKLPIMLRQIVWWDGKDYPHPTPADYFLPGVGVAKLVGTVGNKSVILAVIAGHNDGHHSHVDIGSFVYHLDGESLIPDAGRGKYSKDYFRQARYENIFTNAYGHNIPCIGDRMQQPGPEFGGQQQYHGTVVEHGTRDGLKYVVVDFQTAYAIPELTLARRTLTLNPADGSATIQDIFEFDGSPLPVEEVFVTWHAVTVNGDTVTITGEHSAITVRAEGAAFQVEYLEKESRENERQGVLKRITTQLPTGAAFTLHITPKE
ncbi:MAG: heparinase II/III-family protein [Anaerolineae bacterium]|nr:heparinase II/III-family protein [Anaerolineae bacterium]